MVVIGPHTSLAPLDKDTEEALAVGPLPDPTVTAVCMITAPPKENIVARMPQIMSATIAKPHHTAIGGNDARKHLMHIVGSELIRSREVLRT